MASLARLLAVLGVGAFLVGLFIGSTVFLASGLVPVFIGAVKG